MRIIRRHTSVGSSVGLTRGLSVVSGLLVTAACGANDPVTDLFPNYGDAGADAAAPDAGDAAVALVDGGSNSTSTSDAGSVRPDQTSDEAVDASASPTVTSDETLDPSDASVENTDTTQPESDTSAAQGSSSLGPLPVTSDEGTDSASSAPSAATVEQSSAATFDTAASDTVLSATSETPATDETSAAGTSTPDATSAPSDTAEVTNDTDAPETVATTEPPTTDIVATTEPPTTDIVATSESPTTDVVATTESPTTDIVATTESPTTDIVATTESTGAATSEDVPTVIVIGDTTVVPDTTGSPGGGLTDIDFTWGVVDAGADGGVDAGASGEPVLDASVTEEPVATEGDDTTTPPDVTSQLGLTSEPALTSDDVTPTVDTSAAEATSAVATTEPNVTTEQAATSAPNVSSGPVESEPVTTEPSVTSAPLDTSAVEVGTSEADPSSEGVLTSDEVDTTTDDETSVTACGNGVLEDAELCCTESVVTSELDTRSLATEAALESATTCTPAQTGATDSGFPRVTYDYCVGACSDGNTGCDTVLDNTSVIYDPVTHTVTGFADVTISGTLEWENVFAEASCNAIVTLPGVEFTANVGWANDPLQVVITLTNLDVDVDTASVTGCTPSRPATRSVADMDLAAMVAPAITAGLNQEFAGALVCPF